MELSRLKQDVAKKGVAKQKKKRRGVPFVEHSGPRGAEVNVEFYT